MLAGGRSVNEELVRNGFAYADIRFANDRMATYRRLQAEAIAEKAGLWKNIKKNQLPRWVQRQGDLNF